MNEARIIIKWQRPFMTFNKSITIILIENFDRVECPTFKEDHNSLEMNKNRKEF